MANTEESPGDTTDFGDFVKDEEEELDLEELVEPWHRYETEDNQNVLYPICLGEVLNERYLVEHKLGFDDGSTICTLTLKGTPMASRMFSARQLL